MSVVVRPEPDDQFIKIAIDGELIDVANEHQDFEFEVYADDGTQIGTRNKGRDALTSSWCATGVQ